MIITGSVAIGSVRAWGYRRSLVPAGMGRIDNGESMRMLGWVWADNGAQIKVDPPTIDAVNIPFYRVTLAMPPVPRLRCPGLPGRGLTRTWAGALSSRWDSWARVGCSVSSGLMRGW